MVKAQFSNIEAIFKNGKWIVSANPDLEKYLDAYTEVVRIDGYHPQEELSVAEAVVLSSDGVIVAYIPEPDQVTPPPDAVF